MNEGFLRFLTECWFLFSRMGPSLLFGFFVAGILSMLVSPKTVEKYLGAKSFSSIAKAALFGIPIPLCSCGVLPVSASLRKHGASRGAVGAFLISTPQTGADSIFVTWILLGPVFMVYRVLAALLSGVFGGFVIQATEEKAPIPDPDAVAEAESEAPPEKEKRPGFAEAMHFAFVDLLGDIAVPLLVGVFIAALIQLLIPADFIAGIAVYGFAMMFIMLLFGVPLYVCATASVPIAAALISKGVPPGAVLVFLMTGPATNITSVTTIFKILGRKGAFAYLASLVVAALAAGFLFELVPVIVPHLDDITLPTPHSPGIFAQFAAGTILALILWSRLAAFFTQKCEHSE